MFYFFIDFQADKKLTPKVFFFIFGTGFLTINFFVNDILIPKIFFYDPREIQLSILNEFLIFQKRFFRIYWIKKIFTSKNDINFINESSLYSKELLRDAKMNDFDMNKF